MNLLDERLVEGQGQTFLYAKAKLFTWPYTSPICVKVKLSG